MRVRISSLISTWRSSRAVHQPIPSVSDIDVERIVHRDFPEEQFESVISILNEYGTESYERECPRIRLAVLKLANGGLDRVKETVRTAKQDYRDVLAAAEYPAYMQAGMFRVKDLPRNEQRRIVESDRTQYDEWLRK